MSTDAHLRRTKELLTNSRHTRRLTDLWATNSDLVGWTPTSVLKALAVADHPAHDQLVRALVTSAQHDDRDAAMLLLIALRPGLWCLAHTYHRHRVVEAFDELLASAVQVIARIDPHADRLYHRILGRVRAATPYQRPYRPMDVKISDLHGRDLTVEDDIVDSLIARDRLERLAAHLGQHPRLASGWADLVACRVHDVDTAEIAGGRSAPHVRADISRLARRLAQHVPA